MINHTTSGNILKKTPSQQTTEKTGYSCLLKQHSGQPSYKISMKCALKHEWVRKM